MEKRARVQRVLLVLPLFFTSANSPGTIATSFRMSVIVTGSLTSPITLIR